MYAKGGNQLEPWKFYITKHLGKSVGHKFQSLMTDIVAVDCGIKPGYLYDIGEPIAGKIVNLLKELKDEGLIHNVLSVVQIEYDCIIVNVESLKLMEITEECLKGKLINVSYQQPSPCLYDGCLATKEILHTYGEINDNLDSDKIQCYSILAPTCNVSSLFGLLLGYPVLYWYEMESDHRGNCLSMEKLSCVKVKVKFITNQNECWRRKGRELVTETASEHCLYSFSYPSCLAHFFVRDIDAWFNTFQEKVKSTEMFIIPEISTEERILEVVNL